MMACNPLTNTELNKLDGINKKYVDYLTCNTTSPTSKFIWVESKSDLPEPSSDVIPIITLEPNTTYYFIGTIDLEGAYIIGNINNCLLGPSSENAFITSTGLLPSIPLLVTQYTTPIRNITFKDVDTAFFINGNINPPVALDWTGVNFLNIDNIGIINTCDNFIFSKGAFLNSNNFIITGTAGTIGFDNTIFVGTGETASILKIDEDAVIERRFRVIYSSIVSFGNTTGISVSPTASIPTESYILDTINFSGGNTSSYIDGVDVTDNKTLFENCVGIDNTSVNGQMYMRDNATASIIATASTWVKVAGNTLPSDDNEKYTNGLNRLTNDAVIERKYLVISNLSFDSGNNNQCLFGFYDSRLGTIREPSITKSTANSSGRAENVSFQCVVNHSQGDYIEVWCRNNSSPTDITVTDMNVTITQII